MALLPHHMSILFNHHGQSTYAGWINSTLEKLIYHCLSRSLCLDPELVGHITSLLFSDILSAVFKVTSDYESEKAYICITNKSVNDPKSNNFYRLQILPLEFNWIYFTIFVDARFASDKDNTSQITLVSALGNKSYSANVVCCNSVEAKGLTCRVLSSYVMPLYTLSII